MPCVEALPRTLPRNAVSITVGRNEKRIDSCIVPCHVNTRHRLTGPPKGIDCTRIVGVLWFASLDGSILDAAHGIPGSFLVHFRTEKLVALGMEIRIPART